MSNPGSSVRRNFKTPRLDLQDWQEQLRTQPDRKALAAELAPILTPQVLCYLPETLSLSGGASAIETWIQERARVSRVYTLRLRGEGRLIGLMFIFSGPAQQARRQSGADGPASQILHLGYLLSELVWGQGYATEVIKGVQGALAELPNAPILRAGVARGNPASSKALLRCGFIRNRALSEADLDVFDFASVHSA